MKDTNEIKLMPKGDLHVHLNGLVSFELVKQIIIEEKVVLPKNLKIPEDLYHTQPSSLEDYLKAWKILRLIPSNRANLKLLVESAFVNLKSDNIKFAEIRNSILYLATINKVPISTALGWLVEDMDEFSGKYNIRYGLIMSVPRSDTAVEHFHSLVNAYKQLGKPRSIVGIDLSGNEEIPLSSDFGQEFVKAKENYGFGVTIHAGETGNVGNIITAINDFGADRIGHGTAAAKYPNVMELLQEKNICLEVCPISNRLTKAIKEGERSPMLNFLDNGVSFVIGSDNPQIHQLTLSDDYAEFLKQTGDLKYLNNMIAIQYQYSFIKDLH